MDYSDEAIFALMKLHREMKAFGWCSARRTYIEPRVDGGAGGLPDVWVPRVPAS
jgi:hypothetical protein